MFNDLTLGRPPPQNATAAKPAAPPRTHASKSTHPMALRPSKPKLKPKPKLLHTRRNLKRALYANEVGTVATGVINGWVQWNANDGMFHPYSGKGSPTLIAQGGGRGHLDHFRGQMNAGGGVYTPQSWHAQRHDENGTGEWTMQSRSANGFSWNLRHTSLATVAEQAIHATPNQPSPFPADRFGPPHRGHAPMSRSLPVVFLSLDDWNHTPPEERAPITTTWQVLVCHDQESTHTPHPSHEGDAAV